MSLVAAADLRAANLPQIVGTAEDTRLGALIAQAEIELARWLGFPRSDAGVFSLASATYTFYVPSGVGRVDGPRRVNPRELVLPIRPIISVTTIHQDADESYSTLVAASDYWVLEPEKAGGVVRLKASPACGAWLTGWRQVRIVCVAGWATAPKHLLLAIAYQVQYALGQARTGGKHSESSGGKSSTAGYGPGGSTAGAGIDPRAAALLASDRLWEHLIG